LGGFDGVLEKNKNTKECTNWGTNRSYGDRRKRGQLTWGGGDTCPLRAGEVKSEIGDLGKNENCDSTVPKVSSREGVWEKKKGTEGGGKTLKSCKPTLCQGGKENFKEREPRGLKKKKE